MTHRSTGTVLATVAALLLASGGLHPTMAGDVSLHLSNASSHSTRSVRIFSSEEDGSVHSLATDIAVMPRGTGRLESSGDRLTRVTVDLGTSLASFSDLTPLGGGGTLRVSFRIDGDKAVLEDADGHRVRTPLVRLLPAGAPVKASVKQVLAIDGGDAASALEAAPVDPDNPFSRERMVLCRDGLATWGGRFEMEDDLFSDSSAPKAFRFFTEGARPEAKAIATALQADYVPWFLQMTAGQEGRSLQACSYADGTDTQAWKAFASDFAGVEWPDGPARLRILLLGTKDRERACAGQSEGLRGMILELTNGGAISMLHADMSGLVESSRSTHE